MQTTRLNWIFRSSLVRYSNFCFPRISLKFNEGYMENLQCNPSSLAADYNLDLSILTDRFPLSSSTAFAKRDIFGKWDGSNHTCSIASGSRYQNRTACRIHPSIRRRKYAFPLELANENNQIADLAMALAQECIKLNLPSKPSISSQPLSTFMGWTNSASSKVFKFPGWADQFPSTSN